MQVVIVGAGIVGLYLASKLAKKSKVFLFEKKEKVGGKACSALYSERIFSFLPDIKKFAKNKIEFCLINFPKKRIKIDFKKNFFVFDRQKIEKHLLLEAKKAKAKISFRKRVGEREIEEFLKNFDRLIGCDGANSIVRKFLKVKKANFYLGIQGFLKKKDFSNFVEVWPTKEGFLWKIPRGKEIEYGIIERANRARRIFESFKQKQKIEIEKINCAPILEDFFVPENEKITLCGEAAGLVKPWSGGGVIWGLISANILLKTFPDFLAYQKEIKKKFSKQIFLSKVAKKIVYFLGFKFPKFLFSEYRIDGDFILSKDGIF